VRAGLVDALPQSVLDPLLIVAKILEELELARIIAEDLADLDLLVDRIDLALVYGSVAKRRDHATSDIDLLVVASDLMLEDLYARLDPVERMLGRQIRPLLYSPEEFRARQESGNAFLKKVLAGDTISIIGHDDAAGASR